MCPLSTDALVALVQAERLLKAHKEAAMSTTASSPPGIGAVTAAAAQIAAALQLPATTAPGDKFLAAAAAITAARKANPQLLGEPLFSKQQQRALEDGTQEAAAIRRAVALLHADCVARKAALVKRLDVTLQAFFWSARGREHESELRAAIAAAAILNEDHAATTPELGIEDVRLAHTEVAVLPRVSTAKSRGDARALARFVMPADVPDRGGRPLEPRQGGRASTFVAHRQRTQQQQQWRGRRRGGQQQQQSVSIVGRSAAAVATETPLQMPSQAAVRAAVVAASAPITFAPAPPQQQQPHQQQRGGRGRVQGGWGGGNDFAVQSRRGAWSGKRR